MAATVSEKFKSGLMNYGEGPSRDFFYMIEDAADESIAATALLAAVPAIAGDLYLQSYGISDRYDDTTWQGYAKYGEKERKETGETEYSFSTTGATMHLSHSLATTAYAPPTETAPDFDGAINVENGEIKGVDIQIPVGKFSIVVYQPVATVTDAYKETLLEMTGSVNNATWRSMDAGTVLFAGVEGSQRGKDDWQLTFHFDYQPNITGHTIGTITGIAKKGHEYLWVLYEDAEDENTLVKTPKAVYVEQVYQTAAFSSLTIPA
jgi:hypothetical protein